MLVTSWEVLGIMQDEDVGGDEMVVVNIVTTICSDSSYDLPCALLRW